MDTAVASGVAVAGSRASAWRFGAMLAVGAGLLFAGLAAHQRWMESEVLGAVALRERAQGSGPMRTVAEVARAVRSMKLVTVEIETKVAVTSSDESWRGAVEATIHVPVRMLYGTDLSKLETDAVGFSPARSVYFIRIPRPERIATEVYGEAETSDVKTGWLRLRTRAGEYHLSRARRAAGEKAREMVLSEEDAAKVAAATKEQTESLVRTVVGEGASVVVAFRDEPRP